MINILLCAFAVGLLVCSAARVAVEIYNFPNEAPVARDFAVSADGNSVFVYDTAVAAIAAFGMDGKAEIRIKPQAVFEKVDIRPLSRKIEYSIKDGVIGFALDGPLQLSVELDGNIKRPLYIFANPMETPPVDLSASGIRYFAPGHVYKEDEIWLKSSQTLYIAGGAIVQGYVRADGAENIRVLGPDILDASYRTEQKTATAKLSQCRNVEIRGPLMIDSYGWTVHLSRTSDVVVDNVKLVGWRANSDGIDIEACRRVRVNHCFLRDDDCVAVKNMANTKPYDIASDILIEDTVFWNGVPGNAMEIGFELQGEAIRNVVFRDCDIIRVERGAAFSIHNGDTAKVENMTFENIRVEDDLGDFAALYIGLSIYSADCPKPYWRGNPQRKKVPDNMRDPVSGDNVAQWLVPADKGMFAANRGSICNVTFRNIHFFGKELPPSIIIGYDASHTIEDVTFDGIYLNGHRLSSWPKGKLVTRNTGNIRLVN